MKKPSKTEPKSQSKITSKKTLTKKTAKKVAKKASAKKKTEKKTKIIAKIDTGFGNVLTIRGEGPGLNWERGVIMDCVKDDEWEWTTKSPTVPFPCKFLVNDEIWSTGEDFIAEPGKTTIFEPEF